LCVSKNDVVGSDAGIRFLHAGAHDPLHADEQERKQSIKKDTVNYVLWIWRRHVVGMIQKECKKEEKHSSSSSSGSGVNDFIVMLTRKQSSHAYVRTK
jgi:hypothetical protein